MRCRLPTYGIPYKRTIDVKNGKPALIQNAATILLTDEQTMCLDQIALNMRRNSGHPI